MLSCLVLFFAAIHVINVPDDELLGVSRHLGLAMCFAGVTNLVIFCFKHKKIHGCHWLLADGLSAMCLSFFPLFMQEHDENKTEIKEKAIVKARVE